MRAFNQFLDIELENYHTMKDPYEVERRAVRGDGDSEGTEVFPLRIDENKVMAMYLRALDDNKCAPCSAIYTTGLQSGLMAYEMANPGHLSHRIGEITAAYYGAVQEARGDEEPVLVDSDEAYEAMSGNLTFGFGFCQMARRRPTYPRVRAQRSCSVSSSSNQ